MAAGNIDINDDNMDDEHDMVQQEEEVEVGAGDSPPVAAAGAGDSPPVAAVGAGAGGEQPYVPIPDNLIPWGTYPNVSDNIQGKNIPIFEFNFNRELVNRINQKIQNGETLVFYIIGHARISRLDIREEPIQPVVQIVHSGTQADQSLIRSVITNSVFRNGVKQLPKRLQRINEMNISDANKIREINKLSELLKTKTKINDGTFFPGIYYGKKSKSITVVSFTNETNNYHHAMGVFLEEEAEVVVENAISKQPKPTQSRLASMNAFIRRNSLFVSNDKNQQYPTEHIRRRIIHGLTRIPGFTPENVVFVEVGCKMNELPALARHKSDEASMGQWKPPIQSQFVAARKTKEKGFKLRAQLASINAAGAGLDLNAQAAAARAAEAGFDLNTQVAAARAAHAAAERAAEAGFDLNTQVAAARAAANAAEAGFDLNAQMAASRAAQEGFDLNSQADAARAAHHMKILGFNMFAQLAAGKAAAENKEITLEQLRKVAVQEHKQTQKGGRKARNNKRRKRRMTRRKNKRKNRSKTKNKTRSKK
jgi:hypothetical protein